MQPSGWSLTECRPEDSPMPKFSTRAYPRINRFDLDEAVKYNFLTQAECSRLIKDPNKHNILFQTIDLECATTRGIMERQNRSVADIMVLTYQQYLKGHTIKPELQNDIARDQYLLRLHRLVGYLKHVTQKYFVLKGFFEEQGILCQQEYLRHGENLQQSPVRRPPKDLSLKQLEGAKVQLKEVYSADRKKFQFQLDNHHRYVDQERQDRKKGALFAQHLEKDLLAKTESRNKQLKQRSKTMRDYFKRVKCTKEAYRQLKQQEKKQQKAYYKKLEDSKDKRDICSALFQKRKQDAEAFLEIETKRANFLQGVKDFKSQKNNQHVQSSQEYFFNKSNAFISTEKNKRLQQQHYVSTLKENNKHSQIQVKKEEQEKALSQEHHSKFFQKQTRSIEIQQQQAKKAKEEQKKQLLIQKDFLSRIQENKKQLQVEYQLGQKKTKKKEEENMRKKEESHLHQLESVSQKLSQDMERRHTVLQRNKEGLFRQREKDLHKAEQRRRQRESRASRQEKENSLIMANRLRLKQDMQRRKEESEVVLEMAYRHPLLYS